MGLNHVANAVHSFITVVKICELSWLIASSSYAQGSYDIKGDTIKIIAYVKTSWALFARKCVHIAFSSHRLTRFLAASFFSSRDRAHVLEESHTSRLGSHDLTKEVVTHHWAQKLRNAGTSISWHIAFVTAQLFYHLTDRKRPRKATSSMKDFTTSRNSVDVSSTWKWFTLVAFPNGLISQAGVKTGSS